MKRTISVSAAALAAALLLLGPAAAEAQISTSISGGPAGPTGDAADLAETGFTVQGRAGLSLILAGLHANAGFTRLSGKDSFDDADFFNVGAGAKVGLGPLFWVGANANYYAGGDIDNEVGIVPEVGASIGPLEAVADFKITGDINFWSLRVGLSF